MGKIFLTQIWDFGSFFEEQGSPSGQVGARIFLLSRALRTSGAYFWICPEEIRAWGASGAFFLRWLRRVILLRGAFFTHCSTKFSVGFSRVFLRLISRVILLRGAFLRIFQLNSMGVSCNEVRNFASTLSYTYTPWSDLKDCARISCEIHNFNQIYGEESF